MTYQLIIQLYEEEFQEIQNWELLKNRTLLCLPLL